MKISIIRIFLVSASPRLRVNQSCFHNASLIDDAVSGKIKVA